MTPLSAQAMTYEMEQQRDGEEPRTQGWTYFPGTYQPVEFTAAWGHQPPVERQFDTEEEARAAGLEALRADRDGVLQMIIDYSVRVADLNRWEKELEERNG